MPIAIFPFWYRNVQVNRSAYRPFLEKWRLDQRFRTLYRRIRGITTSQEGTAFMLYTLAKNAVHLPGEFWECGVYKGATALLLADVTNSAARTPVKTLRLFDTFEGIPEATEGLASYAVGNLGDTSLSTVQELLQDSRNIVFHPGLIPETFEPLDDISICFAHVDVDQHASVLECCRFIYPRLVSGGMIVFDDYGRPSTFGTYQAVEQFFSNTAESVIALHTGQALLIKREF